MGTSGGAADEDAPRDAADGDAPRDAADDDARRDAADDDARRDAAEDDARARAEHRAFVEDLIARGEAVPEGEELPPGATHEVVPGEDGQDVKRRRFSAT